LSASHDFGYTTGPWTFQPNSPKDSIVGRGRFITVWHINNSGEWKFLVDLGVNNVQASQDTILRKIEITDPSFEPGTSANLLETENEFISATRQSLKDGYLKYISGQTSLNRHGVNPARTADEILNLLDSSPQTIQFQMIGACVFRRPGICVRLNHHQWKTDNYLHIGEKKTGWKLQLKCSIPDIGLKNLVKILLSVLDNLYQITLGLPLLFG
jgi:hypothetical protein